MLRKTTNPDKPSPLSSFALHRNITAVDFSEKLKPVHKCPFRTLKKHTETTYELETQDGKIFTQVEIT